MAERELTAEERAFHVDLCSVLYPDGMVERMARAGPRMDMLKIVRFAVEQIRAAESAAVEKATREIREEVARLRSAHNGEVCVDTMEHADRLEAQVAALTAERDAALRKVGELREALESLPSHEPVPRPWRFRVEPWCDRCWMEWPCTVERARRVIEATK